MRRVAVVGGGLAGLTVAWRRARAGEQVLLFEAEQRLGGQLFTECDAGFVVEHGAEGYVAASEAVAALADEVGIPDRVVAQLVQTSYGFDGRVLVSLGPGEAAQFLGFQVAARELGNGIRSFALGMGELIDALARGLDGRVERRLGVKVERVERHGGRLRAVLRDGVEIVDEMVVATTARSASALLEPEFGAVAAVLAEATLHSSVTVSSAYTRSDIGHPLDGTGFVVTEGAQDEGLRACTFSSSKLPGRAPAGSALLRVFFRPEDGEIEALPDAAFEARARRALERVLGVREPAVRNWVSRWPHALPILDAEHRGRVAALESALAGSGVRLAGAAFHGSGIDAAVRSAFRAAARGE